MHLSNSLCVGFVIEDVATKMVMELESRFTLSDVMDAISMVYPQFWHELGHEDKLTCYMTPFKDTYGHSKNI